MKTSIQSATTLLILATALIAPRGVWAQQSTLIMPQNYVSDSFYEMIGIHWGFRAGDAKGGVFFDNGGFNGAFPAVGGFDPNSAARFGFAGGGPNGGYYFSFLGAQGSNRSMVTGAPILTLPNGGAGAIAATTLSPFVTGIEPVVGGGDVVTLNPLRDRLRRIESGETPGPRDSASSSVATRPTPVASAPEANDEGNAAAAAPAPPRALVGSSPSNSTASRGDISIAEIRRQQELEAIERRREVESLIAQGEAAEALGKTGAARIFYQQAARRAEGDQRRQAQEKLSRLAGR